MKSRRLFELVKKAIGVQLRYYHIEKKSDDVIQLFRLLFVEGKGALRAYSQRTHRSPFLSIYDVPQRIVNHYTYSFDKKANTAFAPEVL